MNEGDFERTNHTRERRSGVSETDLIKAAADEKIKELFSTLFHAYSAAMGDAAAEQAADARFRAGVLNVRRVRDRATASLPPA